MNYAKLGGIMRFFGKREAEPWEFEIVGSV